MGRKINRYRRFLERYYAKRGFKGKYIDLCIRENNKALVIIIVFIWFILAFLFVVNYLPFFDKHISNAGAIYFNQITSIIEENEITQTLATLCSNFEDETDQVKCVNYFVVEFFDYNNENRGRKVLRTTSELLNMGGVCRDYSLFYAAVFRNLGFETEYVYEPNHVYVRVYGNNHTYEVDQEYAWIVSEGDEYDKLI